MINIWEADVKKKGYGCNSFLTLLHVKIAQKKAYNEEQRGEYINQECSVIGSWEHSGVLKDRLYMLIATELDL